MYEILFKDYPIFKISQHGKVVILDSKRLPFDIYLEESDDIDDRLNNMVNFNSWCAGRILSLDRQYAKEILNSLGFSQRLTDAERAKIAITTRCLSLNDCYWLKEDTEHITWADVNLFDNSLENAIFEVALRGHSMTVENRQLAACDLATDGTAAKAWLRKKDYFYLLKGNKNDSVRREVEASKILEAIGLPTVHYDYDIFDNETVSKCCCFTNKDTNLARAEWVSIWCLNHDKDISELIYSYKEQFDKMNLADYLIGNDDEHASNWGFLYDENMNFLRLNPPMDYDHAFLSTPDSPCLPARFLGLTISQKEMALSIVKSHPDYLPGNVDLSAFSYGHFVQERIKLLLKECQ